MTTKNPDAILRRVRSSVMMLNQSNPAAIPPVVHDLIQAVTDLDNHLSWGGTPPGDWKGAPFGLFTAQVPDAPRMRDAAARNPRTSPHDVDPVEDLIRRM